MAELCAARLAPPRIDACAGADVLVDVLIPPRLPPAGAPTHTGGRPGGAGPGQAARKAYAGGTEHRRTRG
ncbi:hypothetical protein [Streptomyces sp. SS8]